MLEKEVSPEELVGKSIKIKGIEGRATTIFDSGSKGYPWSYEVISSTSIKVIQAYPLDKNSDIRILKDIFGRYKLNKNPLPSPIVYYIEDAIHTQEEFEVRKEILRELYLEDKGNKVVNYQN